MKKVASARPFLFKKFKIHQDKCIMKVGTDGVLLGAWVDVANISKALDIGAGTGVIAIMMGQRAPGAEIHAVEIDQASFEQARDNMAAAPWSDRLTVYHTSIQELARRREHENAYDLIVSNPPFFTGGTISENQGRRTVRHTIKLAHGDLLSAVQSLLTADGRFCVVLPHIEGLRFKELAESYRLFCTKITEVKSKESKPVERLLLQFERSRKARVRNTLVLEEEQSNDRTTAYKQLTKAFYLKI